MPHRVSKGKNRTIMKGKITLIGNKNSGKTTTLRLLVSFFLCQKPSNTLFTVCSVWIFDKKLNQLKQVGIQNAKASIFQQADFRVVIEIKDKNGVIYKVAISTIGDDEKEVSLNWFLFNDEGTYKSQRVDYDVCVSPCHIGDKSTEMESLNFKWRMGVQNTNKLRPIQYGITVLMNPVNSSNSISQGAADDYIKQAELDSILKHVRGGSNITAMRRNAYFIAQNIFSQILYMLNV